MTPLHHPYAHAALHDLLEHIDAILLRHVLQTALDDMVPVGVGAETGDVSSQRIHDVLHHIRLLALLYETLHRARSVHVVGCLDDLVLHLLQLEMRHLADTHHFASLLGRADVQQFLEEIVSEGVHHEFCEVVAHLFVDDRYHLLRTVVQTLLQRTASVVVLRHLLDVSDVAVDVARLPERILRATHHTCPLTRLLLPLVHRGVLERASHLQTGRESAGSSHGGEGALEPRGFRAVGESERAGQRHHESVRRRRLEAHQSARREIGVVARGGGNGREGAAWGVAGVGDVVVHGHAVVHVETVHGGEGGGYGLRGQRVRV